MGGPHGSSTATLAARPPGLDRARVGVAAVAGGCLALAGLSLLLPLQVGGDVWAWLIWGRELLHLELDTTTGPAFKPLPVLFTTVLAPFGDAAPQLWLVLVRASWLAALVLAYRIGSRLAGRAAGAVAAACLLLIPNTQVEWLAWFAEGRSEPLVVALVLGAIDRHLAEHRVQAFLLLLLAALGRPEVWVFLVAYGIVVWRSHPRWRPLVAALILAGPAVWLAGDLWGSGGATTSLSRARGSPVRLAIPEIPHQRLRVQATAVHATSVLIVPVWLAALGATAVSAARRRPRPARRAPARAAAVLGAAALAWIALEVLMAFFGFHVSLRLMAPAAAALSILAGVGMAQIVRASGPDIRILVAGALAALMVGFGWERLTAIPATAARLSTHADPDRSVVEAARTTRVRDRLRRCGSDVFVLRGTGWQGGRTRRLAWELGLPMRRVRQLPVKFVPKIKRGIVFARGDQRAVLDAEIALETRSRRVVHRLVRVGDSGKWAVYAAGCR